MQRDQTEMGCSISKRHVQKLWRNYLATSQADRLENWVLGLSLNALHALPFLFELWAHDHQSERREDYSQWVILGGRGSGKTRAGAEWVRAQVEGVTPRTAGFRRRIALVSASVSEAREVMVFGESGILSVSPDGFRPNWQESQQKLVWPNGAEARVYSAHDPETLRGPQFDGAWLDEFAKWKKVDEAWNMLQFGMRLGADPKVLITTTPRPVEILSSIMAMDDTFVTHATTFSNQANLPKSFLRNIQQQYANTNLGQQEIMGKFVEEFEDALWDELLLKSARELQPFPPERIVVALDPNISSKKRSDACGIVVAGAAYGSGDPRYWQAQVLEDATIKSAKPEEWACEAVRLYEYYGADLIIAEHNQGGEMIEALIKQSNPFVNFRGVFANSSKGMRAEPIAALYRQGRVRHGHDLFELEKQMKRMCQTAYKGKGSPDRVDALVWALHSLLVEPLGSHRTPRFQFL